MDMAHEEILLREPLAGITPSWLLEPRNWHYSTEHRLRTESPDRNTRMEGFTARLTGVRCSYCRAGRRLRDARLASDTDAKRCFAYLAICTSTRRFFCLSAA